MFLLLHFLEDSFEFGHGVAFHSRDFSRKHRPFLFDNAATEVIFADGAGTEVVLEHAGQRIPLIVLLSQQIHKLPGVLDVALDDQVFGLLDEHIADDLSHVRVRHLKLAFVFVRVDELFKNIFRFQNILLLKKKRPYVAIRSFGIYLMCV